MVTRYYIEIGGDIEGSSLLKYQSQYGDYVEYEDYESLENDFKILQRDYQKLVDKIGELYREA